MLDCCNSRHNTQIIILVSWTRWRISLLQQRAVTAWLAVLLAVVSISLLVGSIGTICLQVLGAAADEALPCLPRVLRLPLLFATLVIISFSTLTLLVTALAATLAPKRTLSGSGCKYQLANLLWCIQAWVGIIPDRRIQAPRLREVQQTRKQHIHHVAICNNMLQVS